MKTSSAPPTQPLRFGTDGWRAVIAEAFTFDNVARVAQAAADYWRDHPVPGRPNRVAIGYDRRFFSDRFAQCAAEVFAANDYEVILTPVATPTPAVSLAVRDRLCVGGVMITASHNPLIFNGFKLKSHYGGSSDPDTCKAVESYLDRSPVRRMPAAEAEARGRLRRIDLRPDHARAIRKLVDFQLIRRTGLRLAHDALYGAGAGMFEAILKGGRCKVTSLHTEHDVLFGGLTPEPIPRNYGPASEFLRRHPHDLCLVNDGDADRLGALDGRGQPLTTHQVVCLILYHLHQNRGLTGRVVKTLTLTSMVDKMCAAWNLPLLETGVGFKYICPEMVKGDVLLGAEESGGIGLPGHIPERDGLAAGLVLLELLAQTGKSVRQLLGQLERQFGPHRYGRQDLHLPQDRCAALLNRLRSQPPDRLGRRPVADIKTFDGVKIIANNGAWLMLRGSGTEPVLRIYAEAATESEVEQLLRLGLRWTRQV
ncbi:phosphoglucomutase/phosphomannomutase family protein [Limisphaera ngatamarikiensis]|uniref:Phosphoglucomutase/phosphomannomutase family protein n=1 Tax=Limisphaera ngatamarikiensis TaxID=1324935 RepID=A0A6M1RI94_9BACT|nr:phosphoglucomutase/phosphomannomutase family protein [Limisphaera ngatamarikiensis]NGO39778.1 phosphoglucomutase/phosphomannomutase family protein [Limisphaera ngatamarikiensis]